MLHYRTKVGIINYLDCFDITKILHTWIPHSPAGLWIRCILWISYDLWCGLKKKNIYSPVFSALTDVGVSLDVSHRGFLRFDFCAIRYPITVVFSTRTISEYRLWRLLSFSSQPSLGLWIAHDASDGARPRDVHVNNVFRTRYHRKHLRALLWPLICSEKPISTSIVPLCWLLIVIGLRDTVHLSEKSKRWTEIHVTW